MINDYPEQIKERVTMEEVVHQYLGLTPERGFVLCPFHHEDTASCRIYERSFHCFGCAEHGDVISFAMKFFNLPFRDALAKLNEDFRLGLPIGQRTSLKAAYEAEIRAKARQKERARVQALKVQKEAEKEALFSDWLFYKLCLDRFRPQDPESSWHPLFIDACKNICHTEYLLDLLTLQNPEEVN